ncbi:hypothetical protein AAFF_G00190960 [Aldrovandia affinis]|uniref:Uncharacterized protein n=1 Tax=Aldrovandia affinis TaxID=143900 RepID=A0AAD7RJ73_9TELE|nr:hypothetical protein AAFF_G00190960 [Aldrovandia affinis]
MPPTHLCLPPRIEPFHAHARKRHYAVTHNYRAPRHSLRCDIRQQRGPRERERPLPGSATGLLRAPPTADGMSFPHTLRHLFINRPCDIAFLFPAASHLFPPSVQFKLRDGQCAHISVRTR